MTNDRQGITAILGRAGAILAGASAELRLALARSSNDVAVLDRAVDRFERVAAAFPADHRLQASIQSNLAVAYRFRFNRLHRRADLDAAIQILRRALAIPSMSKHDHTILLNNLGNSLADRFSLTYQETDLTEAIGLLRKAVDATPKRHRELAGRLSNLGIALQKRFDLNDVLDDLAEAIATQRAAVGCAPSSSVRALSQSNLGNSLRTRFERTDDTDDLDAAVTALSDSVSATGHGHPDRPLRLSNLGIALHTRFGRLGRRPDLAQAITMLTEAVRASPADHADLAMLHANLANCYHDRFEQTGAQFDLDAAIFHGQTAVDRTGADDLGGGLRLSNLGDQLRSRFERRGDRADLDAAIAAHRSAIDIPAGTRRRLPAVLSSLGISLLVQFERTGDRTALTEAVDVLRRALSATPADHPDRPERFVALGSAYLSQFRQTRLIDDIDTAIKMFRAALDGLADGHPNRPTYQLSLGHALHERYERARSMADLGTALITLQEAAGTLPAGHPDRPGYLNALGVVRHSRFERLATVTDLDESIATLRKAVDGYPVDHPGRAMPLSNLASILLARYQRIGTTTDLDDAVDAAGAAVETLPADHADRPRLLALSGMASGTRAAHSGGSDADHAAAIDALSQAVAATPIDHPERAGCLSELGRVLLARYERDDSLDDLNSALVHFEDAFDLLDVDDPDMSRYRAFVADARVRRFERGNELDDLVTALDHARRAAETAQDDDPMRAIYLATLGYCWVTKFEISTQPDDARRAIDAYVAAAETETAPPSTRIEAARKASTLLIDSDPARAAELLVMAVDLVPAVAPRRLARGDQQQALTELTGLAGDAAALTLSNPALAEEDRPARALQVLEAGRAVLLGMLLDTRSDLTDLRAEHPALASRFTRLRELLDRPATAAGLDTREGRLVMAGPPGTGRPTATRSWSIDAVARRKQLIDDMTTVLADIRSRSGFTRFGMRPELSELLAATQDGAAVVVNVSRYRSDALLVRPDGVVAVPLPQLGHDRLVDQINTFHAAVDRAGDDDVDSGDRQAAQKQVHGVLAWLWDNAAEPILHELGYRHPPDAGSRWPRVWWAPGGLLGLLPIHAAGRHSPEQPGHADHAVLDRVVSSYTPTIRALVHARQRNRTEVTRPTALVIAMPTTPGISDRLPQTAAEARVVTSRFPESVVLFDPDDSTADAAVSQIDPPTRDAVLTRLPDCTIAHFACHAISDTRDPSNSRLLLHDHANAAFTVAYLGAVDVGQAQLAYLSACRTALTETSELVDEAIHLSSAFQLAGFPHVIGTLWEIIDQAAVKVAAQFYDGIRVATTGEPHQRVDLRQSPYALHHAVRWARARYKDPAVWAAYLHSGA